MPALSACPGMLATTRSLWRPGYEHRATPADHVWPRPDCVRFTPARRGRRSGFATRWIAAMTYRKGQLVKLTAGEHTVTAEIAMASKNGKSLFVRFEAIVNGHVGGMPLLQD